MELSCGDESSNMDECKDAPSAVFSGADREMFLGGEDDEFFAAMQGELARTEDDCGFEGDE
jgi:hypothetical protein